MEPIFELANKTGAWKLKGSKDYVKDIVVKSVVKQRKDIKDWQNAEQMALNAESPKRFPLQNLYDTILIDLHLQSQINNRLRKSLSQMFTIKNEDGTINDELTSLLQNKKWVADLNKAILSTIYYGHSLVEFSYNADGTDLTCTLIPRQNVDPIKGRFYPDYTDEAKFILYRETKEYGTWLLEFGDPRNLGLLNGCVPHVLFKRFAQSCWSELAEIYGIPPRVLKTNTTDPTLVNRGVKMLQEMGAAAYMVIDDNEKLEFAKGIETNGDVYKNLITLCDNQISMGISGAIVGQDTQNGSRAKEAVSIEIVQDLVDSDLSELEASWSEKVIPAMQRIGLLPQGVSYVYDQAEDIDKMFERTIKSAAYFDVDIEWYKEKFGVQVVAAKQAPTSAQLNFDDSFFV